MKVILLGYHWAGCRALELLLEKGAEVAVFTHESPYFVPDLCEYAKTSGVECLKETVSVERLPFRPDLICSVYYRKRIPDEVIEICDGKIFNLHPSLLPEYRGCSSLTWAMVNGESEAGFTYHYVTSEFDKGNIILQERLPILPYDTQQMLYCRAMEKAMESFERAVEMVISGVDGQPQQYGGTYYSRGCPFDGQIDPEWPLEKQKRFVRAMTFPPYPPAQLGGIEILAPGDLDTGGNEDKR